METKELLALLKKHNVDLMKYIELNALMKIASNLEVIHKCMDNLNISRDIKAIVAFRLGEICEIMKDNDREIADLIGIDKKLDNIFNPGVREYWRKYKYLMDDLS